MALSVSQALFCLSLFHNPFGVAPAISFIIFLDFLMFYQIILSQQVKRWAIITYKHGMYELPHELLNDLRLRILGNEEISGKCLNFIE